MTLPSILAYNDFCQDATQYTTRTVVVDVASDGVAVGAYPVENLLDAALATIWKRTSINASTGQRAILDFDFGLKAPYRLGAMVFGILNLQVIKESTGLPASAFDVRLTIGTAPGGTDLFDETYTHIGSALSSCRNSWFVFGYEVSEAENSATNMTRRAAGGIGSYRYYTLYITPLGTGNHTVTAGRAVLMSGLAARVSITGVGAAGSDVSNIQRAGGGTVYANRRTPWRKRSAVLNNLATREVFGGSADGSNPWVNTTDAINQLSGTSLEVALLPFIAATGTEGDASYGRMQMNSAAVFGFLDQPIAAQIVAGVSDGDGALWNAPFSISESVP